MRRPSLSFSGSAYAHKQAQNASHFELHVARRKSPGARTHASMARTPSASLLCLCANIPANPDTAYS